MAKTIERPPSYIRMGFGASPAQARRALLAPLTRGLTEPPPFANASAWQGSLGHPVTIPHASIAPPVASLLDYGA